MIIFGSGKESTASFGRSAGLLARLAADMEAVARGELPQGLAPEDAPFLEAWAVAREMAPCLTGLANGHPILSGVARPVATSQLWLISSDMQWARTLSRWYRLGRPVAQAGRRQ